jgi:hypothetical protein
MRTIEHLFQLKLLNFLYFCMKLSSYCPTSVLFCSHYEIYLKVDLFSSSELFGVDLFSSFKLFYGHQLCH